MHEPNNLSNISWIILFFLNLASVQKVKHMLSDRHHAGVSGPSFWRWKDPYLPGCPLSATVCLHKDIGMTVIDTPRKKPTIFQFKNPVYVNINLWPFRGRPVCATRLTCTLELCLFKCVWDGTSTCPLSSCWSSPLSTLLQVCLRTHTDKKLGLLHLKR